MALELNQDNVDETLKTKKVTILDFFIYGVLFAILIYLLIKKYG
jgi:hypothetical protein